MIGLIIASKGVKVVFSHVPLPHTLQLRSAELTINASWDRAQINLHLLR